MNDIPFTILCTKTDDVIASSLKEWTRHISFVKNHKDTFKSYKKYNPDLIIADLSLGNKTLFSELQQVIKEENPTIIAIVKEGSNTIFEAIKMGIHQFISEPFAEIKLHQFLNTQREISNKLIAFQEHQAKFKVLSEITSEALFLSKGGYCIEANSAAEKMFGYSRKELLGMYATKLFTENAQHIVIENIRNNFLGVYEVTCQQKDGSTFYGEINGSNYIYKGEKIRTTSIRDITTRKNTEQKLQQSKLMLLKAQEVGQIGSWEFDIEKQQFWGSKEALKIYGINEEEKMVSLQKIREILDEFLNKENREKVRSTFSDFLSSPEKGFDVEYKITLKESKEALWLHGKAELLFDSKNKPFKVIGTLQNITQRKKDQKALKKTLEKQKRLNQELFESRKGVIEKNFTIVATLKQLEENERKYRLLVDNSPIGIAVHSDFKFVFLNQKALEMFGANSPDELLGKSVLDLVSNKEREATKIAIQAIYAKKKNTIHKHRFVKPNGETLYVEVNTNMLDFKGKPAAQAVFTDVTKIVEAKRRVRKSLGQQKLLLEISKVFNRTEIFSSDVNNVIRLMGEFTQVSRVYVFENSRDGKSISNTFEWCNKGVVPQITELQKFSLGKTPSHNELINKDGKICTSDIATLPNDLFTVFQSQDIKSIVVLPLYIKREIFGFIGFDECTRYRKWEETEVELLSTVANILSNFYERNQAKEEVRKLSSSVEQNFIATIITNTDGRIEYVNPAFRKATGYTFQDVIGQKVSILKSGFNKPEIYDDLWKTIAEGGTWEGELLNKKKNGELYWDNLFISPIRDEQGDITHYVSLQENITQKKLTAEKMEQLNKELLYHNHNLEQFGYITSHNLRGPVSQILGLVSLFDKDNPKEETTELMDLLNKAAHNIDQVVHDLNHILESRENLQEVNEHIDLQEVVLSIKKDYQHLLKETATVVTSNFTEIPVVYTLQNHLRSVLSELISNAIKYRAKNRPCKIHIAIKEEANFFKLSVTDNGLGIDLEKYQSKIFTMYQRFHLHVYGKGLGLFLIKTQIQAIGGKIEVQSQVDKGSTFEVFLKK